jgi:hypothetical protein
MSCSEDESSAEEDHGGADHGERSHGDGRSGAVGRRSSGIALLERGVAEEKPEPVMDMLLLSLVRPLVSLAEMMLVDPDRALEVVLLIDPLLPLLLLDCADSS